MNVTNYTHIATVTTCLFVTLAYLFLSFMKQSTLFAGHPLPHNYELQLPVGVAHEMVSSLGETKLAVYYRSEPDATLPFVLYSQGLGSITEFYMRHLFQQSQKYMNLIVYDYRGCGRSEGVASEYTCDYDLLYLLEWVHRHFNVSIPDIILWGRSLGSNIVMRFVGKPERQSLLPQRILLFTPFCRYSDILRNMNFPAPFVAYLIGNMDIYEAARRYCTHDKKRRILVTAIRHDSITPYSGALELQNVAPTQITLADTVGHHTDDFDQYDIFKETLCVNI